MKKIFFWACCASLLFSSCVENQKKQTGIKHFYVIGIDAMSVEGLKQASTPNIDKLIANGAFCDHVRTVQPSSSSPNWGSMLLGAGTEIHGNSSNEWRADNYSLAPAAITKYGMFPSVVSVVKAQAPNLKVGMFYQWDGFGELFEKGVADVDKTFPTEVETAQAIATYIKSDKPDFIFAQLDDVDHYGHAYGHLSPEYLGAIHRADSLVGVIMQATEETGIADETAIMIVADHGGIGNSHGGTTLEESTVPFILSGKGIKKNFMIPVEVYMYDVAPTITYALGLDELYAWRGKAICCAFEGEKTPVNPLPIIHLSNDIKINGGRKGMEQAGGLFIDQVVQVNITSSIPDAKIYYTTDGSTPTKESIEYTGPFSIDKTTVVRAKSYYEGGESIVSDAYFRILKNNPTDGVKVSFYAGKDWELVPMLANEKPVEQWTSKEFHIDQSRVEAIEKKTSNNFALTFESDLQIDTEGEYSFYLQSDDGSILYVDGKETVNNDGNHGVVEKEGRIQLSVGKHRIKVVVVNVLGGYWLDAFYKGPNTPKQIIPADKLSI